MRAARWALAPLMTCALVAGCDDGRGGPGPGPDPVACELPPPPTACGMDVGSTLPFDMAATTVGGADMFGPSACNDAGRGAPDVVVQWTAPAAGRYDITTDGSDFDTVLSIYEGCAGAEMQCNDDVSRGILHSLVTVDLEACQTITIVVDGFDADAQGAVSLRITSRETVCDDGVDDDGDGQVDCDDPDCFSVACANDDWPADWVSFEQRALELTNQYRAMGYDCDTEGMFGPAGPLEMDAVLVRVARAHSTDMGEQDYFEHTGLDGRSPFDRMEDGGFTGDSPWGENIAAGQRTPESVVQGWMESDGHCSNIMNPSFRVIGIGYAEVPSSSFGTYWTQNFAGSH